MTLIGKRHESDFISQTVEEGEKVHFKAHGISI